MLNPELNDEVIVRPDGMISTTVADEVEAYGHTVSEVRDELNKKYAKHLKDPEVAVLVRSFAPSRVYVVGEVATPGEFITVGPNLTLVQAIARAGGLKNSAQPDEAVILRRGEGEEPQAYLADYKAAITGQDPSSDIRLEPYDVVVVPRSDVGDAYLYFEQYLQEFVPSSFGMSYQLNPTTSASTP
jgi:polysaccharide export outer membrane protein